MRDWLNIELNANPSEKLRNVNIRLHCEEDPCCGDKVFGRTWCISVFEENFEKEEKEIEHLVEASVSNSNLKAFCKAILAMCERNEKEDEIALKLEHYGNH